MEIIYIILGWLFGILSPAIVKRISEKYEEANFKKVIFNDLKELKKRLAPIPYIVYPKYGRLDKETFEWLKINSSINFSEGLERLAREGNTEEQLLNYINSEGLKKNTSTHFKKVRLFAIDSRLMNLGLITNSLMEKVLEVRFHVEAFNEDVESCREYLKMTFMPGITDINHRIVSQEIENKSLDIAKKSIYIVNKINNIINAVDAREE